MEMKLTVKFVLKGSSYELTKEEAEELRDALNALLGKPGIIPCAPYPVPYWPIYPQEPWVQYIPKFTYTTTSGVVEAETEARNERPSS